MVDETRLRLGIEASKAGDQAQAIKHLTDFLKQNPNHTNAMLWLAFSVPKAQDSLRILDEVLKREPDNQRAHAGVRWAKARLAGATTTGPETGPSRNGSDRPHKSGSLHPKPRKKPLPILYSRLAMASLASLVLLVLVIGGALFFVSSESLAAWLPTTTVPDRGGVTYVEVAPPAAPINQPEAAIAPSEVGPAPGEAPVAKESVAPNLAEAAPESLSSDSTSSLSAVLGQEIPTEGPQSSQIEETLSLASSETGRSEALNVNDLTVDAKPQAVDEALLAHKPASADEKWIEVNATTQEVTAWEGNVPVMHFVVSTGMPWTPTIPGKFNIYWKGESTRMTGPGYDLPGVPYTMYYYGGYALHGAYWHNNFGQPMSHGCVNFRPEEAKMLFEWADPIIPPGRTQVTATADNPGTLVVVHN